MLLHCTVNNLKMHAVSESKVDFLNRYGKSMSEVPSSDNMHIISTVYVLYVSKKKYGREVLNLIVKS